MITLQRAVHKCERHVRSVLEDSSVVLLCGGGDSAMKKLENAPLNSIPIYKNKGFSLKRFPSFFLLLLLIIF